MVLAIVMTDASCVAAVFGQDGIRNQPGRMEPLYAARNSYAAVAQQWLESFFQSIVVSDSKPASWAYASLEQRKHLTDSTLH